MSKSITLIDQHHTELDRIKNIRSLISGTDKLEQYFNHEINWLNQREKQWLSSTFRIGLIGITSSGKSTLVNALLGEKILPEAVRPSSNSLVVCEWGQNVDALVQFRSRGKKPLIIPGKAIANGLKSYADETSNPGNIKDVDEIRIRSPKFRLGNGIILIDTPGLDAHGHDDHEKLTLEVLLPTVDAVIFLATCKANSDEKIKEYVSMVKTHEKPVIVVQNMIDSVVEKLGAHGQIIENKNQVLEKHLRRLQSVLKNAGGDAISIIQCSAKWALEDEPKKQMASGLEALVTGLQEHRAALEPRVSKGRNNQVTRWLREVIRKERSDDPSQRAQNLSNEFKSLQHKSTQLGIQYAQTEQRLLSARRDAALKAAELCAAANALDTRSVDDAYTLKSAIERWLRESPAVLSALNKMFQDQVSDDCQSLNLRIDDINLSSQLWRSTRTLNLDTQEKQRRTRSEQSGVWGWLKRKVDFSDNNNWGYDESVTCWTEITDLSSFRASIRSVTDNEKVQVFNFVDTAIQRILAIKNQFVTEIERQQCGIKQKQEAVADDIERKSVVQQLTRMVPNDHSVAPAQPNNTVTSIRPARIDETWHDMEVAPATLALTELARLIARHRFLEMRDHILNLSNLTESKKRALIIGFDHDSMGAFVNRFWFDHLDIDHDQPSSFAALKLGNNPFSEIGIACLSDTSEASALGSTQIFLKTPCVIFLVLDIQQIGSTERMLIKSMLLPISRQNQIVLVVQSSRELENSDSMAEALRELEKLAQRHKLKVSGVLVNDEDITNSKLAHWLLTSQNEFNSIADEVQLLKELPKHARARATKIVRTWKEQKHTTA